MFRRVCDGEERSGGGSKDCGQVGVAHSANG